MVRYLFFPCTNLSLNFTYKAFLQYCSFLAFISETEMSNASIFNDKARTIILSAISSGFLLVRKEIKKYHKKFVPSGIIVLVCSCCWSNIVLHTSSSCSWEAPYKYLRVFSVIRKLISDIVFHFIIFISRNALFLRLLTKVTNKLNDLKQPKSI